MKKILYESKAIQWVICILAVGFLLSLWPLRIWNETVTTSVEMQTETTVYAVTDFNPVLQSIIAQYDHMDTIDLYINEAHSGESFYLRILDAERRQVCEEKVRFGEGNLPGYITIPIDIDMKVGDMYYIILQGNISHFYPYGEYVTSENMPYIGKLYHGDSELEGLSLVANYNYGVPLRKDKVAIFGAITIFIAAIAIFAVKLVYKKKEDKLVTVEKVVRITLNPVVAVLTAISLYAVVTGFCGKYLVDNTVFFIGVVLLAAILFYAINHNRDGQEAVFTWDYVKTHAGDLLQSIGIAGAIAGCCEYLNGLYDIHHRVAERKEMLWFALAILAMAKWKEVVNLYNIAYFALAGVYGYHYYQNHLTEEMGELEIQVLKYTVWVAILLGLVLIRTLIALFKKKLARPALLYVGLMAVFFAMLIIYRNGRWWGVALVVVFTLFYLNYGMWEHKDRLYVNIARAVIMHFLWTTGYCILHRPYVSYRNSRYTHIFHTVTITATYLTMVECVAAVLLLCKLAKSRKLKDIWKELFFFGVVSSYMIFTMARTAFLSVGISLLFALVVMTVGKGKEKLLYLAKNIGLFILAVVVCMPVTFTIQRNIPALVSEPYLHELEYSLYCPEDVMRGRHVDSPNFMRVGRFIDVFAEKVLQLPEGTFDIYGEIRAYEEENNIDTSKRKNVDMQGELLREIPGVSDSSLLVASTDYVPVPEGVEEDEDYTNGRLDIFRSYIEQSNMTGHEEMGAVLENGEIAVHAHNIYLQVIYDHGIPTGVVFVLVGIVSFMKACLYYRKKKETITYAALPVVIVITVAVAGMVEWIFHISNPCGLLLMLVIAPLIFRNEG